MTDKFEIIETNKREIWQKISEMAYKHEGWIVGKQDYDCYIQGFGAENYCFVVAFNKETDELVGGVCGAHYLSKEGSPAMSSVGDFFLLPEYRNLGLGLLLFDRLQKKDKFHGQGQHLSSAPAMCQKYSQKYGFNKIMPWLLEVYEIPTAGINLETIRPKKLAEKYKFVCPQSEREISESVWTKVFEYDRQIYGGIRRDGYISSVLSLENSVGQIVLDTITNKVVGFGCVREAIEGSLLVSPCYADSDELAREILYQMLSPFTHSLASHHNSKLSKLTDHPNLVFLIPSTNTQAKQVLKELNQGQEATRESFAYVNFTKYVVKTPVEKVFAITDLVMHIA